MTKKEKNELKRNAKKAKKIAKKLGWKKVLFILTLVVALLLGFLGFSYYKYQDPFYFFKPQVEENKPSTDTSKPNYDGEKGVFEHQLYGKNMTNKDSMTVNGLTFTFPNRKYDEYDKGIKLGSKSDHFTESNPWTIETTFPKAKLKGYEVVFANNKVNTSTVGTTYFTIESGSHVNNGTNNSLNPTPVSKYDLNIETTNFKITLHSEVGTYLKSIKLVFDNPSFEVTKDIYDFPAVTPGKNGIPATNYAVISPEEYYKNIDLSQTGPHLRKALQERLSKDITVTSYGDAKTMLIYTDERIDQKGILYSVYDGNKIKAEWSSNVINREHIWPCSKMTLPGYDSRPDDPDRDHRSDLHNLRVLTRSLNIDRSNLYYAEQDSEQTFYPNKSIDVKDDFRGDVARIIFYMALRYDGLSIVENPTEKGTEMGQLSVLKKWNELDPVDDFEKQRNNRICEYQGNRNPFIDHPELVAQLY